MNVHKIREIIVPFYLNLHFTTTDCHAGYCMKNALKMVLFYEKKRKKVIKMAKLGKKNWQRLCKKRTTATTVTNSIYSIK